MSGQSVSIIGRSARRRKSRLKPLRAQGHRYSVQSGMSEATKLLDERKKLYTILQAPADASCRSQENEHAAAESQMLQGSALV